MTQATEKSDELYRLQSLISKKQAGDDLDAVTGALAGLSVNVPQVRVCRHAGKIVKALH